MRDTVTDEMRTGSMTDDGGRELALRGDSAVPMLGWTCVGVEDLREAGLRHDRYENCEMCGKERIRFVHVMEHDDYEGVLRVGCVCAGRMQQDPESARDDERLARNRAKRLETFMRRDWHTSRNGNPTIKYRGTYITALLKDGHYSVVCEGAWVSEYRGRPITDELTMRRAAFDIFERVRLNGGATAR